MRTLCLLLALAGAPALAAQDSAAAPANPSAGPLAGSAAADTASLIIGDQTVQVFRGGVGQVGAARRAEMAAERIAMAARPGPDSVRVITDSLGAIILLNGVPVFVVTPKDYPPDPSVQPSVYVSGVVSRLEAGLEAAEEAVSVRGLAIGFASVAAATLLLIVAFRLLVRGRRWAVDRASLKLPDLKISGVELISPGGLQRVFLLSLRVVVWVVGLLLVYTWITFSLTRFAYTRPWGMIFGRFLATTAEQIGLAILHSIPGLITVALIMGVTRALLALLKSFFDTVARQRIKIFGIHPDTVPATRRIVTAVVWMFAIASAYPFLPGASSESFRGISVLAGVLVTFGSAGIVGQAMSGLLLMYARGFKPGDFVRVGTTEGTVMELGLLSTRIRTVANEFILVPNSTVIGGSITDYSAAGREGHPLFVTASVTIGYDAPWQHIHELLLDAGAKLTGALKAPAPFVLQRALNDFYVHYEVFVPIDSEQASGLPRLRSELHTLIQDTFWAAGQEITSPHFYALRDGNAVTIPPGSHPPDSGRSFRVAVDPK
jgi:small-conductance mechanosensitive channel